MAVEHSTLTDPNIHEPKGVSTASVGFVYKADGSGSGKWGRVEADSIDLTGVVSEMQQELNSGVLEVLGRSSLHVTIPDVSQVSSVIIPVNQNCRLVRGRAVLGGEITGSAVVSFQNSASTGMGPSLTFTDANKGAAQTFTASGGNTFTGPSWFEVISDGGSSMPASLFVTFEFEYILNQDI